MEYICNEHTKLKKKTIISPCRYNCELCKQKRIHGYSNPNHISNPFGYLYLAPIICEKCAVKKTRCMWCMYTGQKEK